MNETELKHMNAIIDRLGSGVATAADMRIAASMLRVVRDRITEL